MITKQSALLNVLHGALKRLLPDQLMEAMQEDYVQEAGETLVRHIQGKQRKEEEEKRIQLRQQYGIEPNQYIDYEAFSFPVQNREAVEKVMRSPQLTKLYVALLDFRGMNLSMAAKHACTTMLGNFTNMTRTLFFSR